MDYFDNNIDFEMFELDIIETPDDFIVKVMEKVENCGFSYKSRINIVEKLVSVFVGLSILFWGLNILVIANQESIINFLSTNEFASSYLSFVLPFSTLVDNYVSGYLTSITSFVASISVAISNYSFLILGVFVLLAGVQVYLYKKDKKEVTK